MKPEKSINLLTRDFKNNLKSFIENQQLPAAIIAIVTDQVNNEIQEAYKNILEIEEQQYTTALSQAEVDENKEENENVDNGDC